MTYIFYNSYNNGLLLRIRGEMKEIRLNPVAELAAYKMGIKKSDFNREDEEKYLRLVAEFDNFRKRFSIY